MATLLIVALAVVGIGGLVAGVMAARANWKYAGSGAGFWYGRRSVVWAAAVGATVGVASWPLTYWMGYPINLEKGWGRIVGIPFFVAYFDSEGRDYVGPLTMPGAMANVLFWLLFPQLVLWWLRRGAGPSPT